MLRRWVAAQYLNEYKVYIASLFQSKSDSKSRSGSPVKENGDSRRSRCVLQWFMYFYHYLKFTFFRSKSRGSNSGNATPEKNGDGDENGDDWSKEKRLKGIFFNFHTNCQWDGDPSVFNLVIILRSTHFYQYIKHTKVFAGTIKVSKSRREKRNTGVQSIPFFRVKSRFEDVYVPFDKLLQPNQLGGCRLPHPLSDLPWWQSLHQDDQGEVWWVVVYSFSKRFRWWWKVI